MGIFRKKGKSDAPGVKTMELDDDSCPAYMTRTVRRGIKRYHIPIDSEGYVPTWAIFSRYHEVCGPELRSVDNDTDDERVLPPRLTPEEIVEWWADPTSCDIEGIDTLDSEFYDVSCLEDPVQKEIQSRIAVVAPTKSEADRIRKTLAESFTLEELDEMTADDAPVMQVVPSGGDAYGVYLRKQPGVPVPIIIYENGTTKDSIVHEMTHHMRTMESRKGTGLTETTFPMKKGSVDMLAVATMTPAARDHMNCAEEALTVAETELRTRPDPCPSGYYDDVPKQNILQTPRAMYSKDQAILKGGKLSGQQIVRGSAAVVPRINLEFDNLNIAEAVIYGKDSAKIAARKACGGTGRGERKPEKKKK